jgi:hypothetical protein
MTPFCHNKKINSLLTSIGKAKWTNQQLEYVMDAFEKGYTSLKKKKVLEHPFYFICISFQWEN